MLFMGEKKTIKKPAKHLSRKRFLYKCGVLGRYTARHNHQGEIRLQQD